MFESELKRPDSRKGLKGMTKYKNDPFMPVNDAVSDLTVDYCLNYFSIVAQTHPFFPPLNFLPASLT